MSLTRAQLRIETVAAADATGSQRWTAATIDALLTLVHQREWVRILQANPMYRKSVIVPVLTAGAFPIASLTTGAADAVANLYRIVGIGRVADGAMFEPLDVNAYPQAVIAQAGTLTDHLPERLWWRDDATIRLTPSTLTTGQVAVAVNTFPCRISALSADNAVVPFPDGYEMLLAFEAGADMLGKAGAETQGMVTLKGLAEEIRRDMLADIARLSLKPLGLLYADSAAEWAG